VSGVTWLTTATMFRSCANNICTAHRTVGSLGVELAFPGELNTDDDGDDDDEDRPSQIVGFWFRWEWVVGSGMGIPRLFSLASFGNGIGLPRSI
jgi:hypothetical protein